MPKRARATTKQVIDRAIDAAEKEVKAQLAIIQGLRKLSPEARPRILEAIDLLLQADKLVPGILEAVSSHFGKTEAE